MNKIKWIFKTIAIIGVLIITAVTIINLATLLVKLDLSLLSTILIYFPVGFSSGALCSLIIDYYFEPVVKR